MEEARGRQLLPSASSELECWSCCGNALNATGPYFFNLAADDQCYCCETCTPVNVPDWTVRASTDCILDKGNERDFDTTYMECKSGRVASLLPHSPPSSPIPPPHFAYQPRQAYTSYNRPEWTNRVLKGSANWAAIGGSADSNVLLATDAVWIYRSTNYGANWTQVANSNLGQWRSIACDDTGTTCVAVTFQGPGAIYRSTNGGVAWSIVSNTSGNWVNVWCANPNA